MKYQPSWLPGASARPIILIIGVALACVTAVGAAQIVSPVSVWSGVYTAAQSKRGEEIHADVCAICHGSRLNGAGNPEMPPSPAIAGTSFVRKWSGRTVGALFLYVRQTMPPDSPGTLTEQQALDAIAHMFATSKMPAGDKELPSDQKALANIKIEAQP
jgi:cytochrome c